MSQGAKRKRLHSASNPRKRSKDSTKQGATVKRGPAVRGDQLKWKPISISQHLDDAEGFYGLEEIEDVEVVRDENGNNVLFKPAIDSILESSNGSEAVDNHGNDGEEWSGFDDESPGTSELESNNPRGRINTLQGESDTPQDETSPRDGSEDLSKDVRFDVLRDVDEDINTDMSAWSKLGISAEILSALSSLGFSSPTRIQQAAIPAVISGKDVIGKAVTGSGKTLAFGVPIVQSWLETHNRSKKNLSIPIAIILAPTRELAHQISKHLTELCRSMEPRPQVTTVTGGLSILKQQRQLETSDIVVATPGRLWEVIQESNSLLGRLKLIRFLVVDEADRLLSEGHFQEVEEILSALDRQIVDEGTEDAHESRGQRTRQILVFSATFHKGLQQKLASRKKFNHKDADLLSNKQSMDYLVHKLPFREEERPFFVDANPESQMAENLAETIIECGEMEKDLYLYVYLLQEEHRRKQQLNKTQNKAVAKDSPRVLVFTNSVSAVKRLVPLLQILDMPSTSISPLHSNMPQKSRLRSLERFSGETTDAKPCRTSILVATDVAARGLDIKGVTTVVHYHVPRAADTYVHRSGRTARVQASGSSILLCSPDETASVTRLIAKIHRGTQAASFDKAIDRMYLPNSLVRQVKRRVDLAQKVVNSTQSTEKVKSEQNWLKTAAEDLGVDYDSEEFEKNSRQGRRGRGAGKERMQKQLAQQEDRTVRVAEWRAQLKDELRKRIDYGDGMVQNMKFLAGGAFDVDKLLAERAQS